MKRPLEFILTLEDFVGPNSFHCLSLSTDFVLTHTLIPVVETLVIDSG